MDRADAEVEAPGDAGSALIQGLIRIRLPWRAPLAAGDRELQAGDGALACNPPHLPVDRGRRLRIVESHL